jgi:hypothetical protein
MTFEERVAKSPYHQNPDEIVYSLTQADVVSVLSECLSEEEVASLNEDQIDRLIQGTVKSLDHIDWRDWTEAGAEFWITEILAEKENEDNE